MNEIVHAIIRFAEAHAALIYVIAFLSTYLESIAVVGLFIPGSSVIVALGAFVPSGAVGFWPLCLWSIIGAIAGDGTSYWVGRRYSDRLRQWWPLRKFPAALIHGEQFFAAHGGKSVFLSRFVAPVRGAVPLVAGMAGLAPRRFIVANVASALGWAPAHILPGMLIGAGLTLTGVVATRLLVLVIVIAGILWLAAKLTILAVRYGSALIAEARTQIEGWARRHDGWLASLVLALLEPDRGEIRALVFFGFVLAAAAGTFFGVLEDVVSGDPLVRADTAIYNLLQALRSNAADRIMIGITELGGTIVVGSVAAAVLCWLLYRQAGRTAVYWIAAAGGADLIGLVIKVALHRHRPIQMYAGWDSFSFPSGHATSSAAIYGFLAVLLAHKARPAWQAAVAAAAVLLVALIGFSRLYLGAHWFSDVIGGIAFGTAWIALLAIAYVRHNPPPLRAAPLASVAVVAFLAVGGFQIVHNMPADLERYAARMPERSMTSATWWRDGWRRISLQRLDLSGEREEPLVLQWAGGIDVLENRLTAGGWRPPPSWSAATALHWLARGADPLHLPVLPRLHDGRGAALTLIHAEGGTAHPADRWVIRVWKTGTSISTQNNGTQALWVGAITLQRFRGPFAPLELGFERGRIKPPWPLLAGVLKNARFVSWSDKKALVRVMLAHDSAF